MRIFKKDDSSKPEQQVGVGTIQDEVSDESLMTAMASGAVWAMESLYQRYYRMLYSFAYRIVADHQVAEDLLQESFLSVWRHAQSYSSQSGGVRSWLFSILHHRAIDYLRTIQRRSAFTNVPLEEVDYDERTASPDAWDEAWLSVQRTQVREALMRLPKEQRMVIELAYFQGWTHVEIAEGCQMPLGTVKARMRLGLMHLKRYLEKKGINEL